MSNLDERHFRPVFCNGHSTVFIALAGKNRVDTATLHSNVQSHRTRKETQGNDFWDIVACSFMVANFFGIVCGSHIASILCEIACEAY